MKIEKRQSTCEYTKGLYRMNMVNTKEIDSVSFFRNAHKICSSYQDELTSFDGDTDGPFEGELEGLNDGERVGFSSIIRR